MPSQFLGLNIAYTGLLASNAALNTTSNNISNVQTEGYSRQQVNQQAAGALRAYQTFGCIGAGVDTLGVERIRDEFYDSKFWDNNHNVGEYSMKQYYMEQLETYFDDNGQNAGFKSVYDQFMVRGLEELMKTPGSASAKSQFVGYAGGLTEYFNGVAGNLEVMQKDINQEIKLKVDEVNSLAGEIATLNKQINTIELAGTNANELRDRRSLLVDRLSEIVDVEVTETKVVDTNQPDRETGATRFLVKIAGGQLLVDANEFRGLECVARNSYEKVNQSDIDGLYDIRWEDGQRFNLYNAAMGGALKGLIEMRDGNNGENFTGTATQIGTTEDGNNDTVTVEVGMHYLKDLNKCNLSDQGGIITLGNREYYYDSWSLERSFNDQGEEVYAYKFVLSNDTAKNPERITADRVGKLAEIGADVDYQGIPYYMSQMNEWVRTFSQKFNDILKSGYDSQNRQGTILFTADMATDTAQFQFPDENRDDTFTYEEYQANSTRVIDVSEDSYYRMTAKNFTILTAMDKDPSLLANRFKVDEGLEQNDLLVALRSMADGADGTSFRGSSPSEFLQSVLSDVALNAQRANTMSKNFKNVSNAIDTRRLSISGVDEDEEAVNLVKFQNGYNLASKMIQVLSEIYDRLILETGV